MNPTDPNSVHSESAPHVPFPETPTPEISTPQPSAPIVGYCRATGVALTAAEATTINGVLYSKAYAEQNKLLQEPPSPYIAATVPQMANPDVSPGWAFILGFIPGVGAIYNQQYAKGLFHIIVFGLLVTIIDRPGGSTPLIGIALAGWLFYMPFEAFHTARKRQLGQPVEEMSSLFQMPGNFQRLPLGPILLIVAGVIFLLDNLGVLRIDDLIRFWPVLMIVAGIILLMQRLEAVSPVKERGHAE